MVLNAKQLLQKRQKIAYIQYPQHFIFEMEIKRVQFIHYALCALVSAGDSG